MKKRLITAFLAFLVLLAPVATDAQIDISVRTPKLPKMKNEKTTTADGSGNHAIGQHAVETDWYDALRGYRLVYDESSVMPTYKDHYISPYLYYYAQKHQLDPEKVGYFHGRTINFDSYETKQMLADELPVLAAMEQEFKQKFPNRPNTGKKYEENPAIWADILTDREAYFDMLVADLPKPGDCDNLSAIDKARIATIKEDMQTTLEQAKSFTAGKTWYVEDFNDSRNEYLQAAISPSQRNGFEKKWGALFPCLEGLLDEIAAAAKETLPLYKPIGYNVRNAAEEKLLRSAVNDLHQAKELGIGLLEANWLIQKDNLGIPQYRYKHGMIHAQYPTSSTDDGFCRIIYVNIIQDYAGGGTYGASYAHFIKSQPAGCPTR